MPPASYWIIFLGRNQRVSIEPSHHIGEADEKDRLLGIPHQVEYLVRICLEIDLIAVEQQMMFALALDQVRETRAQPGSQEPQHAPHLLQRNFPPAQLFDCKYVDEIGAGVDAPASFPARDDDLALVPPLQLTRSDAG